MTRLFDGTVLPTYLQPGEAPLQGSTASLSDFTLRVGEVVDAYPPNSPSNVSQKEWEYIVNVSYRHLNGPRFVMPYRCRVADFLGGLGDHLRYTVRQTPAKKEIGAGVGQGALVLILCINSDRSEALIVGGKRQTNDVSADPSELFWDFAFNGVHLNINKDGEFLVEVMGATKVDGSPDPGRDADNHGSFVTVKKNGEITVSDRRSGDGESIRISPKEKLVEVKSNDVTIICTQNCTLHAKKNVLIKADKDATFGGSTTHIGTTSASENLPLGNSLAKALAELVGIFTGNFDTFIPTPVGPMPLNPVVMAQLLAWTSKYGISGGGNPFLSSDKFTQK